MKKLWALALTVLMVLSMFSVASAEVPTYRIGWSSANNANEANVQCLTGAQDYVDSLTDVKVELIILDGEGSGEKQVAHCETFISMGVDCVIMQPYDAAACQVGVEMCQEAGVPVFTCKSQIEDNSICSYVGQDDTIAGEIEMQWIADQMGGKGNIVIIEGPTGISAAILRNQGIENVLENYPDINVLYTQPGNWNREEGMALMENWLQLGEQIDAVVAHNDEMALGAYDAISDANKAGEILVIGIDAIDAAVASVKAGELHATVLQDSYGIGKLGIEVALKVCAGETIDLIYNVDPVLLTTENIGEYFE
jgi:inositol transport system substrate-binding protein